MIGVLSKGYSFRSLANYLLLDKKKNPRGRIVGGVMSGRNPRQLSREFGKLRALNPKLGRAVAHFVLSPSPDDPPLSDEQFAAITEDFMVAMGFGEAPWCAVAHDDSGLQHVHIMASRIDFYAKTIPDAGDFRRSEVAVRRIEREFGLVIVDSPPTTENGPCPRLIAQGDQRNKKKRVRSRPPRKGSTEPDTPSNKPEESNRMDTDNNAIRPNPFHPDDPQAASWPEPYEPGRDLAEIAMIETFGANAPSASAADEFSDRKRREMRRVPHDDPYQMALREIFPTDTPIVRRYARVVVLVFRQPQPHPGRLADHGDKIVALGARPDQDALNAQRIVSLARQRSWKAIKFSGTAQFVEFAMRQAMFYGITIHAQGEAQAAILAKIVAERQGAMGSNASPVAVAQPAIDPLLNDPILAPLLELHGLISPQPMQPAQTSMRTAPPSAPVALPPAPAETPETLADALGYPLHAPLHELYGLTQPQAPSTPKLSEPATAKPAHGLLPTTVPMFRNLSERLQQRRDANAPKKPQGLGTPPAQPPRAPGSP
jgi:hypothetical protein